MRALVKIKKIQKNEKFAKNGEKCAFLFQTVEANKSSLDTNFLPPLKTTMERKSVRGNKRLCFHAKMTEFTVNFQEKISQDFMNKQYFATRVKNNMLGAEMILR